MATRSDQIPPDHLSIEESRKFRKKHFPSLAKFEDRKSIPRESLIQENISKSEINSHTLRGFYNLIIVAATFYAIAHPIISLNQNGEYFNKKLYTLFQRDFWLVFSVWPMLSLWSYHAYIQQLMILKGFSKTSLSFYRHFTQSIMFLFTILLIVLKDYGFTHSLYLLIGLLIHFFKMHSYTETNIMLREESLELKKAGLVSLSNYPRNINLQDFSYFIFAPTLVYWYEYPRTSKIAWLKFFRCLGEGFLGFVNCYIIVCESILPIIESGKSLGFLDVVMRLALPCIFLELCFFYFIWEAILKAIAEIMRFADRSYYQDWWNSTSFREYMRKWNTVVHEFLYRHIYLKCQLDYKMTKLQASTATLLFSAVFHELIMALVFKVVKLYLTLFMLTQIPLSFISRAFKSKVAANYFFWICIVIGVPLVTS